MREIKFRVWDNIDYLTKPFTLDDVVMGKVQFTTKDSTVMQYTGLKDKNGKEIYEGDIIYRKTRLFSDSPWKEVRYVIRFDEKEGAFLADGITGLRHYFEIRDPFEVIGNIYENPELIK